MADCRVLLVGAGHAHLEVLRRLALARPRDLDVSVVTLEPRHYYSGMTPGYLAGRYSAAELTTDVAALAEWAGASCRVGGAVAHDPAARLIRLSDGAALPYDLVSFNIGSLLAGGDSPASGAAERIKPLERVSRLKTRLEALAGGGGPEPVRLVVIGGGSGGVEVAFAVAARLDRAGRPRTVTIVERGPRLLAGYGHRFRCRAEAALSAHRIRVVTDAAVVEVRPDLVRLLSGDTLPCDLAVWLTGPMGSPLLASSGLPLDSRGFLLVDDALRSPADPRVFAAGDCATLERYRATEKSGVHAVREAPVLWQNLLGAARGETPTRYRPQRSFLSILNTGDGRALLRYRGVVSWSRWAWRLKDSLDRRFMARYRTPAR